MPDKHPLRVAHGRDPWRRYSRGVVLCHSRKISHKGFLTDTEHSVLNKTFHSGHTERLFGAQNSTRRLSLIQDINSSVPVDLVALS